MDDGRDDGGYDAPLDPADPRYTGFRGPDAPTARQRRLVATKGPGASPEDPRVRLLRVFIPATFLAAVAGVIMVFVAGLNPPDGRQVVGAEAEVRAAVSGRPHRVCYAGRQPCAWLTVVDGELLAFNTSGPINAEFGRLGVAWCPSSGYFGSNVTNSRYDPRGTLVRGPAPRGLDRFPLLSNPDGHVVIDFFSMITGTQKGRAVDVLPPTGPDCAEIPFDREADLDVGD